MQNPQSIQANHNLPLRADLTARSHLRPNASSQVPQPGEARRKSKLILTFQLAIAACLLGAPIRSHGENLINLQFTIQDAYEELDGPAMYRNKGWAAIGSGANPAAGTNDHWNVLPVLYGWPGNEIYYNPISSADVGYPYPTSGLNGVIRDYSSNATDVVVVLTSHEPDLGWNDAWGGWGRNCSVTNYVGGLDKMWLTWISAIQFDFEVDISNLDAGTYDIYVYGHGDSTAPENSGKYTLTTPGGSSGPLQTTTTETAICDPWEEGLQYVVFRDVELTSSSATINILVEATPNYSMYEMSNLSGIQIVPVD